MIKLCRALLFITIAVSVTTALSAQDKPGKALGNAFVAALIKGDAKAVANFYSKDAIMFSSDAGPFKGREAIRKDFAGFFSQMQIVSARIIDSSYTVVGDFCYGGGIGSMTVRPKAGGDTMTINLRFTDVQRRINGRWLYVSDHLSMVPPQTQ